MAPVFSENSIPRMARGVRENQGIIPCDAGRPARARNIYLRPAQVAAPATGREPVSTPSTQYRLEGDSAAASIARERPGLAGLDDSDLPRAAHFGPGLKPETILRWHRAGFKAFWRWKSRRRTGRPKIDHGL